MGNNHCSKFVGHYVCLSSGKKFVTFSLAATHWHGQSTVSLYVHVALCAENLLPHTGIFKEIDNFVNETSGMIVTINCVSPLL